jgi:predicted MFS family arabinose efflux permease
MNLPEPAALSQPVEKTSFTTQVLALTALRTLVNTMHRMVYPLLPVFARGFGVDFRLFTEALAARSFLGALSPLIAWVGDIFGRKFGILLGILLFNLGVGLVVIWPTFEVFVLAISLAAVG